MHFPMENPVIVLALCLFIMFAVPAVSRRIGMPSIFGLILSGILIGPKGFHLIGDKSLDLLSTAGLLYLMFLMTLEIDMSSFRKNKFKSVWFGVFTFIIPFVLGFLVTYYVFNFNITASLLLACMFSTHTLVSYPIASRLNITKSEPVVVSIGGTIITDMAVLVCLTIIITSHEGALTVFFWAKSIASLAAFAFVMFWCFPKVCRLYFSHFQSDETGQYIFVLCSLFSSGFLAKLAGIEPIVGAFTCGLVLNRIIPPQSMLMNRTVFIGNSVFIPFFLIYIGMLVDVRAFFQGFDTLVLAAALIFVALFSKYFAAFVTKLFYRYTKAEHLLLFGLSSSHAAATIAVIIVGYHVGIFNEHIINAVVLIILFTCLISTYVTDYAGRMVALQQKGEDVQKRKSDHILVPLSNPDTAWSLFDFSILIQQPNKDSSVSPLTIATTPEQVDQSILNDPSFTDYFGNKANTAKKHYLPIKRVDSNISEGIIRAAMELPSTHIVLGWTGKSGTARYFFGTIIEKLLKNCPQTIMVVNLLRTSCKVQVKSKNQKFRKICVMMSRHADREAGFQTWMNLILALQYNTSGELQFISDKNTLKGVTRVMETTSLPDNTYQILPNFPEMKTLGDEMNENDLLIVISARPNTVSYNRQLAVMPRVMTRYFSHTNHMILYPEQVDLFPDNFGVTFGGL